MAQRVPVGANNNIKVEQQQPNNNDGKWNKVQEFQQDHQRMISGTVIHLVQSVHLAVWKDATMMLR